MFPTMTITNDDRSPMDALGRCGMTTCGGRYLTIEGKHIVKQIALLTSVSVGRPVSDIIHNRQIRLHR